MFPIFGDKDITQNLIYKFHKQYQNDVSQFYDFGYQDIHLASWNEPLQNLLQKNLDVLWTIKILCG